MKERARQRGIHPGTAYCWFRDLKLPVSAHRVGGRILMDAPVQPDPAGATAAYALLSSAGQKADLDGQVARATAWAAGEGLAVGQVITETGSALNGKRRKFLALLGDPAVTTIVVEHRDRFARFGSEYVEAALSAQGRRLMVMDPAGLDDHLVRDVAEVLASLCARLYGRRAAANRAARAIEVLRGDAA